MAGRVLQIDKLIDVDDIGCSVARFWQQWNIGRSQKVTEWNELRRYIYATDTRHTSAGKLPWSNSTTIPKLTQIRDNLFANYMASMFPKRKWLNWEGAAQDDENRDKVEAIKNYMMWCVNQPQFKPVLANAVLDYVDYGNSFATVEWVDESHEDPKTGIKLGYVGPRIVRISPQDLVMNPIAPAFANSPKIWRALMSLGEAKEIINRMTQTPEQKDLANTVMDYCKNIRSEISNRYTGYDIQQTDDFYNIDGFTSYRQYLESDYVELLTFAGDIYDRNSDTLYKNRLIVVIDRHKTALNIPYPYPLAEIPIYHTGWRPRQDNLWAMGPLDNLVGLQYRLDHVENMKSDILDLTAYPPIMIRGSGAVNDFNWGPMERIYVDADGDVSIKSPDVNALNNNIEIQQIMALMEEMAGSPKEAMGFRTPGEKTAYEVQRLENAAARIFANKISQFEEQFLEPLLNAMLTLARENLTDATIRVIDSEYGVVSFENITRDDLSANGRLKPIAARHFAEQAELIQNLTQFYGSAIGSNPSIQQHFSSVKMAEIIEECLNLQDYEVVLPYVGISEAAEQQKLIHEAQESAATTAMTPSGLTPDDWSDPNAAQAIQGQGAIAPPSAAPQAGAPK